jgi:hypothetical protein
MKTRGKFLIGCSFHRINYGEGLSGPVTGWKKLHNNLPSLFVMHLYGGVLMFFTQKQPIKKFTSGYDIHHIVILRIDGRHFSSSVLIARPIFSIMYGFLT